MDNIGQSAGKNLDFIWLAGFLDGDGSVCMESHIMKNRMCYSPRITFSNTDENIIEEIKRILKENNIGHYEYTKKTVNAIAHDVSVVGFKRVQKLIPKILPYIKGRKFLGCYLIGQFLISRHNTGNWKTYTEEEIKMCNTIKELHNPGYPQRLYAERRNKITDEDIVRTAQKCAEFSAS